MLHLFSGILEEGGTREHSFGLVTPSRTFHLTAETDVDRRYIHVHVHLYIPKYVHVHIPIHVLYMYTYTVLMLKFHFFINKQLM